ncbi:MAG: hypothetical protein MI867_29180 [Pseudomonadales bacterium]|nr:hypothetical protein [Pseudomonadales bacterium]
MPIITSYHFTVDSEAVKKMANEANWSQGELHEISVTEHGAVSIDGREIYCPKQVLEQRKADREALDALIEKIKASKPSSRKSD